MRCARSIKTHGPFQNKLVCCLLCVYMRRRRAEGMTIILNANIIVSAVHHYQVTRYAKPRTCSSAQLQRLPQWSCFVFLPHALWMREWEWCGPPIKLPLCCSLRSAKPPNLFSSPMRCAQILMDVNNWEHGSMNTLKNDFRLRWGKQRESSQKSSRRTMQKM